MPDRIPITVAERIGKEHGYDQVIINARRANADDTAVTLEWVTTWGKNKLHCDIAARIGNAIRDNVAPTIDRLNDALARETARADAAEAEAKALRERIAMAADDFNPEGSNDAELALSEMRDFLRATLAQPAADGGK